jgi:HEAT repeat protein
LNETFLQDIKDALPQAEEELRNGALISAIVLFAYNNFDFDFSLIEKQLERAYSHKVALLSLSNLIEDKKIRKKYNGLIKKYVSDGYSSVRKAAAFSEPLLWAWEKEKNQKKKIEQLIKNNTKLNPNYLEGVLLGLAVVSKQLEPDAVDEILEFYKIVQQNHSQEQIMVSTCFGLSLYGIALKKSEFCVPILFEILKSQGKKIRSSAAQALAFSSTNVELETGLEIIKNLFKYPAYQETWPLDLAIIITFFRHSSEESTDKLLDILDNQEKLEPETTTIRDLLNESNDPLTLLTNAATANYSQLRLTILLVTYYIERHKEELGIDLAELKKFAMLSVVLLGDPSGVIRSFSLFRLLSLSITLNTSEFVENFKSHLKDQLKRNRLISSIAIAYLTALYNPTEVEAVKKTLMNTNDPQVRKGMFIGLGMGFNPSIHESQTADEQILGLLELTGEATYIGFILTAATLL